MAIPAYTANDISMLAQTSENMFLERVVIANGASESTGVPTQGRVLVGILMPAAWTAANFAYKASFDGINYSGMVQDPGGNVMTTIGPVADAFIAFPQSDAVKAPFLKLVSVDSATPPVAVNQGAERAIFLVFSRFLGGS